MAPALGAHLASLQQAVLAPPLAARLGSRRLALLAPALAARLGSRLQAVRLARRKRVDSGPALAAAALVLPSPARLLGLPLEELLGRRPPPSVHQLGLGLGLAVGSAHQPVVPLVRRGEVCLARRKRVDLGAPPLATAVLVPPPSPARRLLGLALEELLGRRRLAASGRRRQQAASGPRLQAALAALASSSSSNPRPPSNRCSRKCSSRHQAPVGWLMCRAIPTAT